MLCVSDISTLCFVLLHGGDGNAASWEVNEIPHQVVVVNLPQVNILVLECGMVLTRRNQGIEALRFPPLINHVLPLLTSLVHFIKSHVVSLPRGVELVGQAMFFCKLEHEPREKPFDPIRELCNPDHKAIRWQEPLVAVVLKVPHARN